MTVMQFVRSYQAHGHFVAQLDPLKILDQGVDRKQFKPELLTIEHYGFTESDYDTPIYIGEIPQFYELMRKNDGWVTLREVEKKLKEVYCGTIGYQYMHIANAQKNNFLRSMIERDDLNLTNKEKIRLLDRLTWSVMFEV